MKSLTCLLLLFSLYSIAQQSDLGLSGPIEQAFADKFKIHVSRDMLPGMRFTVISKNATDFYPVKKSKYSIDDLNGKEAIFLRKDKGNVYFEISGERWYNGRQSSQIEGMVYNQQLQSVKDSLIGKELYLLKDDYTHYTIRSSESKKFCKVKVTNVKIGEDSYAPYHVYFVDDAGREAYTPLHLGDINVPEKSYCEFPMIFSFTNPKSKYPNIDQEVWRAIISSKPKIGMNSLECRLALGEPKDSRRTTTSNLITEQWSYDDFFVYFDNGKLTTIQDK